MRDPSAWLRARPVRHSSGQALSLSKGAGCAFVVEKSAKSAESVGNPP